MITDPVVAVDAEGWPYLVFPQSTYYPRHAARQCACLECGQSHPKSSPACELSQSKKAK